MTEHGNDCSKVMYTLLYKKRKDEIMSKIVNLKIVVNIGTIFSFVYYFCAKKNKILIYRTNVPNLPAAMGFHISLTLQQYLKRSKANYVKF